MKVYLAGPLGFSETSKMFHDQVVVAAMIREGYQYFDPWTQPVETYDIGLSDALALDDIEQRQDHLRKIWRKVGEVNRLEIDKCDIVLACLDGTDVDSGTAAEIGYAAARGKKIVAWRNDVRLSGEEAMRVNLQVQHFIEMNGGRIHKTLQNALDHLHSHWYANVV